MGGTKRVTLETIARETGVSITTISKVLNGRGDVAPSTRERIEAHLQEREYSRPGSSRSDVLEVVLHELDPHWSVEVVDGVRAAAEAAGLHVTLAVNGDRHAPSADWVADVVRRRPAGVVLIFAGLRPDDRRKLEARGIPFVVLDPAGDPASGTSAVGSTNWRGGLLATRHLIDLGHRAVATITGPLDMMSALARADGYRSALASADLVADPAWVRHGDFHEGSGDFHATALLTSPDPPTAIFAGNDLQAIGVLRAAGRLGVDVPGDLSVVGYDDIPVAKLTTPPLTTIHQPLRRMAEQATRIVLDMRDGRSTETTRIDLATSLVVRESTAPPRR
jgi:LacI family xylobiose transport system transcriptional regulator